MSSKIENEDKSKQQKDESFGVQQKDESLGAQQRKSQETNNTNKVFDYSDQQDTQDQNTMISPLDIQPESSQHHSGEKSIRQSLEEQKLAE